MFEQNSFLKKDTNNKLARITNLIDSDKLNRYCLTEENVQSTYCFFMIHQLYKSLESKCSDHLFHSLFHLMLHYFSTCYVLSSGIIKTHITCISEMKNDVKHYFIIENLTSKTRTM